ncbi:MAG: hypothetical protein JW981_07440 [Anaerolineae bacterium]|nr:hypothetical protein [Anaerolineae bacterium]
MFKKLSLGLLVAVVLSLSVAGLTLAQGPTPPMGMGNRGTGGRFTGQIQNPIAALWQFGQQIKALAEGLNMSIDDLIDAVGEGQTITELAEAQDVDIEELAATMAEPIKERLAEAVEEGTITQEQADKQAEAAKEMFLKAFEVNFKERMETLHSNKRRQEIIENAREIKPAQMEAVAEILGITTEELREAVTGGQTVAELAEEKNVALDVIVEALMEQAKARIQEAVDNERIDQEKADELLEKFEEQLIERLNEPFTGRSGGRQMGQRPGGKF